MDDMAPSLVSKIRAAGGRNASGDNVNKSRIQWLNELCENSKDDRHTPNDLDFRKLSQLYGQSVSSYLENGQCGLTKAKTGAFFIERPEFFKQCIDLAVKDIKYKRLAKKRKSCRPNSQLSDAHQRAISEKLCPKKKESKPTNESDGEISIPVAGPEVHQPKPNTATNLKIYFIYPNADEKYVNSRAKAFDMSRLTCDRIKRGFLGEDLYKHAMETRDGTENFVDPYDSSEAIRKLLTQVQRRHCKFSYFGQLNNIMKVMNKAVLVVTLKQYLTFVYQVYAAVIPSALFGCNRNAKKLRKVLKAYYLSPFKSPIDLEHCINSLDISKIHWLEAYKEPILKRTMLAKITKWIFESYFFVVFRAVFHEEAASVNADKRIMMSMQRWIRFKRDYIATKMRLGRVEKVSDGWEEKVYLTNTLPRVTMILKPKTKGARPIHKSHANHEQEKDIELLKTFLVQLYLQRYEFLNFNKLYSTWRNHATETEENNARRKLNLVCCDVADAFGSIVQEKFMCILMEMMDGVPEKLYLDWYEVMRPRSEQSPLQVEHRQWFSYFREPPVRKACSLIVRRIDKKTESVTKDYILSKLRAYIFEQTFWYENNEYRLLEGVCQGTSLSSIMADIYYQQMTIEYFGTFLKSGSLFRYVDDFLYATTDEATAKRFLRAVKRGVPEYNCRFASAKMQKNFKSRPCGISKAVAYIGYTFNGETMAIRPKWDKSEPQYSRALRKWLREKHQSPNISELMKTHVALKSLKLHPMVVDPKLNAKVILCATAGFVAYKQATFCAFLLTTSFTSDTLTRHSKLVIREIPNIVKRLEQILFLQLPESDRAQWPEFQKDISLAIWQSFCRTFAKNPQLREIVLKIKSR